jgi:E1A/CREB-binding protein
VVTSANQTPPHPGTTPSPAGLGKGMTSQERAALNAPRSSSMSSQMAAITAALDHDNSPSPLMNNNKGKLDTIKEESNIKMELDHEESSEAHGGRSDAGSGSGKNVNNDMTSNSQIKNEIKQEPMDEGSGDPGTTATGHMKVMVRIFSTKRRKEQNLSSYLLLNLCYKKAYFKHSNYSFSFK